MKIQMSKKRLSLIFSLFMVSAIFLGCAKDDDNDDHPGDDEWWKPKVGDSFAGGIIIQVNNAGDAGIVAIPEDVNTSGATWGCPDKFLNTSSSFGSGINNTKTIINECDESNIVAVLCDELDTPSEADDMFVALSDWFLPSLDELKFLYNNKHHVGDFSQMPYWTSTDFADDGAYVVSFLDGQVLEAGKSFSQPKLRCLRTFQYLIK